MLLVLSLQLPRFSPLATLRDPHSAPPPVAPQMDAPIALPRGGGARGRTVPLCRPWVRGAGRTTAGGGGAACARGAVWRRAGSRCLRPDRAQRSPSPSRAPPPARDPARPRPAPGPLNAHGERDVRRSGGERSAPGKGGRRRPGSWGRKRGGNAGWCLKWVRFSEGAL